MKKIAAWIEKYALTGRGIFLFFILAFLDTVLKYVATICPSFYWPYTFLSSLFAIGLALLIAGIASTPCKYPGKEKDANAQLIEALNSINSTLDRLASAEETSKEKDTNAQFIEALNNINSTLKKMIPADKTEEQ